MRGHCPIQPNADGFAPEAVTSIVFHSPAGFMRDLSTALDPLELSRDRRVAEQKAAVVIAARA